MGKPPRLVASRPSAADGEWVEEPNAFDVAVVLEVFGVDGGDAVLPGRCPDQRVPEGEAMAGHGLQCTEGHCGGVRYDHSGRGKSAEDVSDPFWCQWRWAAWTHHHGTELVEDLRAIHELASLRQSSQKVPGNLMLHRVF